MQVGFAQTLSDIPPHFEPETLYPLMELAWP